jgi:hypothetical protein
MPVDDEELAAFAGTMSCEHGLPSLDFVEAFYDGGVEVRGTENLRKMARAGEKVAPLRQILLDNDRRRSVSW